MSEIRGGTSLAAVFLLAFGFGSLAGNGYGAVRQQECWSEDRAARVWPEIVFQQAADLSDYRLTMTQSRDEVRRMLTQEFVGVLDKLVPAGGSPKEIVEAALSAVMAFDDVHDRHKERAVKGVPVYLEVGIRSALDALYRSNHIPLGQRRLRFVSAGLVDRLKGVRREMTSERSEKGSPQGGRFVGTEGLATLRQVAETVDLVPYATLSSEGSRQVVTLTLENVRSGSMCNFEAAGDVGEVAFLLAQELFREFQAVDFPPALDPNPNLTWVRPSQGEPVTTAAQARHYCASQGADVRLPYAVELTTAAGVGARDASFVEGGIPLLDPGPWIVADRLYEDDQYYYFQPPPGEPDNHPLGPVRTNAGLGQVTARYWCVKGPPAPPVVQIERLYELHRTVRRTDPGSPALAAVEYLLTKEGALGARQRYAQAFPSMKAAWAAIAGAGCATARAPGDEAATSTICSLRGP